MLGPPKCVFWDTVNLLWSTEGCAYNGIKSNYRETVCECSHLTSFGIIMDWTGFAPPSDAALETLTYVFLSLSMISLIASEVLILQER